MRACQPFSIDVPDHTITSIRSRVRDYPWHEMPDDGGWDYGTNLDFLKGLCDYWVDDYDWYKEQARINRFTQFIAPIDGT